MDDIIQTVNQLQDILASLGGEVDLPQIVVVGSQSSGKSSVLETIVGRDFLPRGQGIVTRRPLILQLVHTAPGTTEYGQFIHLDKQFEDFGDIRKEIEAETFRVAGQNKGISKLPINLRVHSPNLLDLTLVDLPGLTKIPVGDQAPDIERQIRNLCLDYISKPNSIILAMSPANADLANSESLKLARSVDPQGRRTIGVLSKLDLMDAGTNAVDVLSGRLYPLKLGFIGVVMRSQQDIISERGMKDAIEAEAVFFSNHPAYRSMPRNGTKYLAKTLNQVLMNHIRDKLPDMKARLNTLVGQTQQELNALGDSSFLGDQHPTLMLRLMTQFANDFVSSIEGTSLDITKELNGGARIYYIFNDVFGHALESIEPTSNLSLTSIRTAIRNSAGPRASLFVPEKAFQSLVKSEIALLEAPSLRCVEMVYEELVKICHNCTSPELQRFPRLHSKLIEVVSELLRERLGPTLEYISSLIAIECAYINTNHPDFVSGSALAAKESVAAKHRKRVLDVHPGSSENETSSINDGDDIAGSVAAPRNGALSPRDESLRPTTNRHQHHQTSPKGLARGGTSSSPSFSHPNSSAAARDSFLSVFFGTSPHVSSSTTSTSAWPAHAEHTTNEIDDPLISASFDLHSSDSHGSAFNMRSIGKSLEATSPEQTPLSAREEMETGLIRSLIATYFSIVRRTIQDLVPKCIIHMMVGATSTQVHNRLVASLYRPEMFSELLNEDEGLVEERNRVRGLLNAYKEASKVLSEVKFSPVSTS